MRLELVLAEAAGKETTLIFAPLQVNDERSDQLCRPKDHATLSSTVGEAFANEVIKQLIEDQPVWENKAHLVRPALADTDGPVMKFRKWASQFYADPVDTGAEAYPPQGVYPAPERELTASKKFGNPDSAFAIDKG